MVVLTVHTSFVEFTACIQNLGAYVCTRAVHPKELKLTSDTTARTQIKGREKKKDE